MPAADQIDPAPAGDADIIHLSDHVSRRTRPPGTTMTAQADNEPQADESADIDPVGQAIGERLEALFRYRDQTLTDPQTARAMETTMEAVINLTEGALKEGKIGQEQYDLLRAVFDGMRRAPGTL